MADTYEICGFCGGRGQVFTSMFNRLGEQIADKPPLIVCDYCAGTGSCINGSNLWPAPSRETILRRQEKDLPARSVTEDDGAAD